MSAEQARLQAVQQEPKIPELDHALTVDDFEERGVMAFEAAWDREQEHDGHIDMRTAALYGVASRNLVDMAMVADVPHDPRRLLMLSHSFAAQAEAPEVAPYRTPQYSLRDRSPVDRRQNFKRLAGIYLEQAGIEGDSAKVVLEAAVEAAHKTADGRPVVSGLGEISVEHLADKGQEGVHELVDVLANQPGDRGAEFTRFASGEALRHLVTS